MSIDADIGLADMLRCERLLGPGARERVARLLGYTIRTQESAPTTPREPTPQPRASTSALPEDDVVAEPLAPSAALRLTPIRREAAMIEPVDDVEPLDTVTRRHLYRRPARTPLLPPDTAHQLLAALVASDRPSQRIDVAATVDLIARGRPLTALPRRRRPSLAQGVQVLVDGDAGMAPFSSDPADVIAVLRRVVGRAAVTVLRFERTVGDGAGHGPPWKWKRYLLPPPGQTVLVLSDFGVGVARGRTGHHREWFVLRRRLAHRRSQLIGLAPIARTRLPPVLQRLPVVVWDRTTTTADVIRWRTRHSARRRRW